MMHIPIIEEGDDDVRVEDDHSGHSARRADAAFVGYTPLTAPADARTTARRSTATAVWPAATSRRNNSARSCRRSGHTRAASSRAAAIAGVSVMLWRARMVGTTEV